MGPHLGLALLAVLLATGGAACAPAELTSDQIVAAFIAASQDDARTMHMEWTGTIHTSQGGELGAPDSDVSLLSTFEFSGADYEGVLTTTVSAMGGSSTMGYAQVGGVNFTRYEGGAWQLIEAGALTAQGFDPLGGLSAAGVAYEEPETIDGRLLHRLRVTDALGALQRTLLSQAVFSESGLVDGGASDYLVYVDGQGVPVAAQLHVDVRTQMMIDPTGAWADVEYGMTSDYEFSDWGAEITIVAPPVTGGGFDDKPPPPLVP